MIGDWERLWATAPVSGDDDIATLRSFAARDSCARGPGPETVADKS